MIGRLHGIVIDCPDPRGLASFYEKLLGMQRVQNDPDWVVIGDAPDRVGVAFQRIEGYSPTTWPTAERPQYRHFDVKVDDLEAAAVETVKLGAIRLPGAQDGFVVFADPAGHPFCLVTS